MLMAPVASRVGSCLPQRAGGCVRAVEGWNAALQTQVDNDVAVVLVVVRSVEDQYRPAPYLCCRESGECQRLM